MVDRNSWDVSFSTIKFFESALKAHSKVASVRRSRDILFHVERVFPLPPVKALLLNEYALGLAAVFRALEQFPGTDCIIAGGDWNGYTAEAKAFGSEKGIGIFVISELLGALNLVDPYRYAKKDKDGDPIYAFKNA